MYPLYAEKGSYDQDCTSLGPGCPASRSPIGYQPNLGGNVILACIFVLCLLAQLVFLVGFRGRRVFCAFMCLGLFKESIGYGGRIMLHYNPFSISASWIQFSTILISPSLFLLAIYTTTKDLTIYYGSATSRFTRKPKKLTFLLALTTGLTLVLVIVGLSSSITGIVLLFPLIGMSLQTLNMLIAIGFAVYIRRKAEKERIP
ncbi:hypothetical protein K470DRAFT_274229 [Piedraia hortae CBS 480.64]|uniref:G-protein coupled receptors family 3 profile domain-containing protein n=1 Tax=Piedraia hortae CBS 480.64 TaxID=1314780 RepID=A0A6A7C8I4_9PEZI|nr:hypothetical protein K470DRAFT_274229 [Piedraia hortae CBS 480.64]